MSEFKSVQDLIIKAALRDGVSTTISPNASKYIPAVDVTFSKGYDKYSFTIDLININEDGALYMFKRGLNGLFMSPYNEITVKEN